MKQRQAPTRFGDKYLLLEKIGSGGMAEIFRARSKGVAGFERELVIKRILSHLCEDKEFVDMFIQEAKTVAILTHPNIVQIFDLGRISGQYFISMEYIPGKDLGTIYRKKGGPFPPEIAAYIIKEVLKALSYAHNKRDERNIPLEIVHRDVSPQNILISYEGEVKLTDFGIAKISQTSSKTRTGLLKGKYAYMSPEQAFGQEVDHQTDIFSCGIILYELVTGKRLFKGKTDIETLRRVQATQIPPISKIVSISQILESSIYKALKQDKKKRYQTAEEFYTDLEEYLNSLPKRIGAKDLALFIERLFAKKTKAKEEEEEDFIWSLDRAATEIAQTNSALKELSPQEVETQISSPSPSIPSISQPSRSIIKLPRFSVKGIALAIVFITLIISTLALAVRAFLYRFPAQPKVKSIKPPPSIPTPSSNSSKNQDKKTKVAFVPSPKSSPQLKPKHPPKLVLPPFKKKTTKTPSQVKRKPLGFGYLDLNVYPWAYVYIKGKKLPRATPIAKYRLREGRYPIKIVHPPTGRKKRFVIDIKRGKITKKVIDLR
jgi:serine/threonine protein kinase